MKDTRKIAAAALIAGGKADSFKQGIKMAGETIDRGLARKKLEELIYISNRFS